MKQQRKFAVDFYLAGTVTITAKDKDEAIRKASQMAMDELSDCVENCGFGKYYVNEL